MVSVVIMGVLRSILPTYAISSTGARDAVLLSTFRAIVMSKVGSVKNKDTIQTIATSSLPMAGHPANMSKSRRTGVNRSVCTFQVACVLTQTLQEGGTANL